MSHVLNVGEILTVNARLYPRRTAVRDLRRALSYAEWEQRAASICFRYSWKLFLPIAWMPGKAEASSV